MPGHRGECRTAAALADRRARLTERRREKTLDTEEVTGSIPVSPTSLLRSEAGSGDPEPASRSFVNDLSTGSATVRRHVLNQGGTERP